MSDIEKSNTAEKIPGGIPVNSDFQHNWDPERFPRSEYAACIPSALVGHNPLIA
jgi:hypothetical protein